MHPSISDDSRSASFIVPHRIAAITTPPLSYSSAGAHPSFIRRQLGFIISVFIFVSLFTGAAHIALAPVLLAASAFLVAHPATEPPRRKSRTSRFMQPAGRLLLVRSHRGRVHELVVHPKNDFRLIIVFRIPFAHGDDVRSTKVNPESDAVFLVHLRHQF